jgi:hypothetical protein
MLSHIEGKEMPTPTDLLQGTLDLLISAGYANC